MKLEDIEAAVYDLRDQANVHAEAANDANDPDTAEIWMEIGRRLDDAHDLLADLGYER